MSWSASAGGVGEQAGKAVGEQLARAKEYSGSDPHHKVVDALADAAAAFASHFPGQVVTIESSGHMDQTWGNATLTMRAFPGSTAG